MSAERGLDLHNVSLSVAGRRLFAPLTLHVTAERPLALMGASGTGKSSLLAWLSGTLSPAFTAEGNAFLDGDDLALAPPERRRLGMLFQDDLLFPHLSVGENLAFGLPAGLTGGERRARIRDALAEVELAGFGERDPASLSGGQRARIALMRTLLAEPRALLLDEPFAKLDLALRARMRALIFEKATRRALPVLLVSHDPADAEALRGARAELVPAFDEEPPAAYSRKRN